MDVWRPFGLTPVEAEPPGAGCPGPCPGSLFDDRQGGGSQLLWKACDSASTLQCLYSEVSFFYYFFFRPGCFL